MTQEKTPTYIWLDDTTFDEFVKYRKTTGLEHNAVLVRLLIVRELKLRRLSNPWNGPTPSGSNKISVPLSAEEAEIHQHLPHHDLSEALRRLVTIELEEKWFARALVWIPDQ